MNPMRTVLAALLVPVTAGAIAACGSSSPPKAPGSARTIVLYTCASANVEQAVIKGFEAADPGSTVQVFRAPTGQLNARVASDVRTGGIRADIIWACDPLTMHNYDTQKLLRPWSPPNAGDIPAAYRTANYTGVDLLYVALAVHKGVPAPAAWSDLTSPSLRNAVALPNPSIAASALGALGYLSSLQGYGMNYYRALHANGAKQVDTPAAALTGAETGAYKVGMTLANAAYADQRKGSPISVVWPRPGGIAVYAPIGLTTKHNPPDLAARFADYVASPPAQRIMAAQDTYPVLPGLGGPPLPAGSTVVSPDWPALYGSYQDLLSQYVALFGT
jgi:iron(III) transport system substrate-binding protein